MGNKTNSIHLPGINGLRAIAALSVMWGHVFHPTFGEWGVAGFHLPVVADGVTLFFVISGFLITYLLLNEAEQTQQISIPKFYMRRILRIWPIYYLYMIVALLVASSWSDSNVWYYLFFVANIPFVLNNGIALIVHYWSIGVEEQFYLFWPWLVKFTRGKQKKLLLVAAVLCLTWLLLKWGAYIFVGKTTAYRFFAATRFDCMMIGAIGAILFFTKNKRFNRLLGDRVLGVVSLLLLFFSQPWSGIVPAPVRPQLLAVLSLFCIMSQLHNPVINLENRVCDFVGKISYGIYVIHPLLIFLLSKLYCQLHVGLPPGVDVVVIYILVTAVTVFVAWLSYRFFESPFLKLKNRFAIVKSRSSMG